MSNIIKRAYPVLNMHCTGCAATIERAVRKLAGVTDVSVSYDKDLMSVSYDAARLSPGEIRAALLAIGYDLALEEEDYLKETPAIEESGHYRRLRKRVAGAWVLTVPLLLLSVFSAYIPYADIIQMILAAIVMAFFGTSFYVNAWRQICIGRAKLDTLVALSTSVAFFFSAFITFFPDLRYAGGLNPGTYYEVTVVVIAFVLTGKLMEERAKGHASVAIHRLRGLQPEVARFMPEGERMDDRIAGIFVPVVLFLSALTFFVWIFWGGTGVMPHALFAALSILIIACPCALGLATPIALMAGISKAADSHVLVKDALGLEQMSKVDVVVFDKTGTLTEGHPSVTGWLWAQGQEEHYKDVLLAAELTSDHPLANAIIIALEEEEQVTPARLDGSENIIGKGVKVVYQGAVYWVGSHKLLKDFQANLSDILVEMLVQYESEGNSIVYFGRENELLAIIAIKDRIKATSAEAIKELRGQDIDICMLTGDGERTASAVATSLGILRFMADTMPEDKEDFIRELQLQGRTVAMVGDGVNDSRALACADVSIAMAQGTDTAMDVAMVTLMTSDLLLLPKAFRISHLTVTLMNKNLFWAFIYNLVAIPVAAGLLYPVYGILMSPLLAVTAMALSCVSVLLNSLRLPSGR